MRRMWPAEFNSVLHGAEAVTLELSGTAEGKDDAHMPIQKRALKARIPMEQYERIWPLAEMRFRLDDPDFAGKAITLITTNPHYHAWHPADGGSEESVSDSGRHHKTDYVVVHFLLDEVKETAPVR
ncbi:MULTISPECIES: hypothetical protein [unclassified Sinorhizobium]|uniref:hypothetical protein n=1 Tax=unclassified Sinorhizobium TaxID=2613772 RepID=UPI0035231350